MPSELIEIKEKVNALSLMFGDKIISDTDVLQIGANQFVVLIYIYNGEQALSLTSDSKTIIATLKASLSTWTDLMWEAKYPLLNYYPNTKYVEPFKEFFTVFTTTDKLYKRRDNDND